MPTLLVILGAGASYDFIPDDSLSAITKPEWRPTLARQLFEPRPWTFGTALDLVHEARAPVACRSRPATMCSPSDNFWRFSYICKRSSTSRASFGPSRPMASPTMSNLSIDWAREDPPCQGSIPTLVSPHVAPTVRRGGPCGMSLATVPSEAVSLARSLTFRVRERKGRRTTRGLTHGDN